jgi:hypothetical protein
MPWQYFKDSWHILIKVRYAPLRSTGFRRSSRDFQTWIEVGLSLSYQAENTKKNRRILQRTRIYNEHVIFIEQLFIY